MFKEYLASKRKRVILTKEQTDGIIGGLIKSNLKKEWKTSPLALQLLFVADRAHHLASEIEPALKQGKIVVCDRYIFSTIAFGALGINMKFLKYLNSKFRRPDITFVIDTPPEVCLQRIERARFHRELFEEKKKLEQIRRNFLSLKKYFPHVYFIRGDRTKEEVFRSVLKVVEKIYKI